MPLSRNDRYSLPNISNNSPLSSPVMTMSESRPYRVISSSLKNLSIYFTASILVGSSVSASISFTMAAFLSRVAARSVLNCTVEGRLRRLPNRNIFTNAGHVSLIGVAFEIGSYVASADGLKCAQSRCAFYNSWPQTGMQNRRTGMSRIADRPAAHAGAQLHKFYLDRRGEHLGIIATLPTEVGRGL